MSPLIRGLARSRLLDLGVVPGTVLEIDIVSPAGDPVAYRIRGALDRAAPRAVRPDPRAPREGSRRMSGHLPRRCASCPVAKARLEKLGVQVGDADYVVALAGNPNTGKTTVFNALTGLRQHTGNWPGKTVTRAEGGFVYGGKRFKIVDLPGTYSLLSASADEEVARDFILFGRPT